MSHRSPLVPAEASATQDCMRMWQAGIGHPTTWTKVYWLTVPYLLVARAAVRPTN